jgi:hypothetical protein
MPNDIIRQTINPIPRALSHLGEALGLGLVFKRVAGEINARAVDVCFDDDVDAADAVEWNALVFVVAPVAHLRHVFAVCGVLFVA